MRLLGLTGLELALAAAAVGAAVLLLYLLRRPTRVVVTPALFLWDAVDPERKRASALFARLRRVLSLLLALAIALLLLLALADPTRNTGPGRQILIAIDRSASMAAHDVSPSRLEQAKERARRLIRSLRAGDRALVATIAGAVTPLTAMTGDPALLLQAVDDVRQSDAAASLSETADLAIDLLSSASQPELALFSDGNLGDYEAAVERLARAHIALSFEPIGSGARNVAITNFAARHYPLDKRHSESLVALTNFGAERERGTLRIRAGGELLFEQPFTLAAHATDTRVLSELPTNAALLEASITLSAGADLLATDDRALASVPPRARTRVLAVSEGNRYLEAALLLDEYLEVSELPPSAFKSAAGYRVAIFDRTVPTEPSDVPALYLGAPGAAVGNPLPVRGEVERPFFERVKTEHPLVHGLALADVNIARAALTTLVAGDVAIGESERAPLIVQGERAGVPFISLTFDVRDSDLPLRPAWPLLVLRAIDRLAGDEGSAPSSRVAGEPFELALPAATTRVTLIDPDGTRSELPGHGARRIVCDRAGAYRVETSGQVPLVFAVRMPSEGESAIAIASRPRLRASQTRLSAPTQSALQGRLWPVIAACALLLVLLEWLTFHRRWTV